MNDTKIQHYILTTITINGRKYVLTINKTQIRISWQFSKHKSHKYAWTKSLNELDKMFIDHYNKTHPPQKEASQ